MDRSSPGEHSTISNRGGSSGPPVNTSGGVSPGVIGRHKPWRCRPLKGGRFSATTLRKPLVHLEPEN